MQSRSTFKRSKFAGRLETSQGHLWILWPIFYARLLEFKHPILNSVRKASFSSIFVCSLHVHCAWRLLVSETLDDSSFACISLYKAGFLPFVMGIVIYDSLFDLLSVGEWLMKTVSEIARRSR